MELAPFPSETTTKGVARGIHPQHQAAAEASFLFLMLRHGRRRLAAEKIEGYSGRRGLMLRYCSLCRYANFDRCCEL